MNDLLNPNGPQVPALAKFKNMTDDGRMVASHPPLPVRKAPTKKYYTCTLKAASMHNVDGKKIPFVDGFLATDLLSDQQYLDNEIADGNPYVKEASPEQVELAKMKLDPLGTMEEKLRPQIEQKLRAELEAKIRAELTGEAKTGDAQVAKANADANKIAGVEAGNKTAALEALAATGGNGAKLTPVSTAQIAGAAKQQ